MPEPILAYLLISLTRTSLLLLGSTKFAGIGTLKGRKQQNMPVMCKRSHSAYSLTVECRFSNGNKAAPQFASNLLPAGCSVICLVGQELANSHECRCNALGVLGSAVSTPLIHPGALGMIPVPRKSYKVKQRNLACELNAV